MIIQVGCKPKSKSPFKRHRIHVMIGKRSGTRLRPLGATEAHTDRRAPSWSLWEAKPGHHLDSDIQAPNGENQCPLLEGPKFGALSHISTGDSHLHLARFYKEGAHFLRGKYTGKVESSYYTDQENV